MDFSKRKARKASPHGWHGRALSLLVPLLCLAVGAFCLVVIADLARDNVTALMQSFRFTAPR